MIKTSQTVTPAETRETPSALTFFAKSVKGPLRKKLEDRSAVQSVCTLGGLELTVGIVADGVGGNVYGEIAAQRAVAHVFETIRQSRISQPEEVPPLLRRALEVANHHIFMESRADKKKRGMASTAVLAAIHQNILFLANVGDSRAYLVGPHQITQLSIDHSWANDVVRQGRYTPQDALDHPKAGELRRSVGFERRVLVDIGFYAGIDPLSATNLSRSEITQWTLTPGDRVLLCSDGLIANRPSPNLPFVSNAEIVRYINAFAPQTACETLCELAVSRRANDNVSVLIIETAGSSRRQLGLFFKLRRFLGRRRRFVNWFLLILFLLLVVGLAIWVFVKSNLSLEYVSILNVLIVNLNAYEAVQ